MRGGGAVKEAVTILLAGGVGSRLNILVRLRAKPAVPFGGVYRIIDFTLSNIAKSGLTDVAVLTQYKPLSLMDHVGDGSAWDLSGRMRRVKILPPKTGEKDWDWYKGTADAVRQNLDFITLARTAKYVVLLSGDHVYHMDYRNLIEFHEASGAKLTIGMIVVPWEETHNFGIGIVDGTQRIVDWEEKPARARSNLASMGIYVFDADYLVRMLKTTRQEDFGHHIIPKAMQDGHVYAYPFQGYWRDVGTIQAYWDANMDLLTPFSDLQPERWGTMTNVMAEAVSLDRSPIKFGDGAAVSESAISPGCVIDGTVEHSVLSPGVVVEKGAVVRDSVIMHDTVLKIGAHVERSILDKEVFVGEGVRIGCGAASVKNRFFPDQLFSGLTIIGKQAHIPRGLTIGTNCIIHPRVKRSDLRGSAIADGEVVESREGSA
jgi:glucose-1-phosphate adenylyltransferase